MRRIISILLIWFMSCGMMIAPKTSHPFGAYFKDGVSVGNMDNSANWQEQSGLTTPRLAANAAYMWSLSDAPANQIQAIALASGANSGVLTLTGQTAMVDLEDIESMTVNGVNYLYGMDFGNNGGGVDSRGAGRDMRIFRVIEPTITGSNIATSSFIEIECVFPGGNPPTLRDMEATIVDETGKIWVFTKRDTANQKVYSLAHATSYSGIQTLVYEGTITYDVPDITTNALGATAVNLVDGALSLDGKMILLKNYDAIYYWNRDPATQTIIQALQTAAPAGQIAYVGGGTVSPRKSHPSAEPQGEGIAFDFYGVDLYSNSEYVSTEGSAATKYPFTKYARVANKAPTTYTFQEGISGYSGTLDTTIWDTNPAVDYGADLTNVVDTAVGVESDQRKMLLKFDISSIPSTCKVISTKLDLYLTAEGQGWKFHKMLVTWVESSTYNSLTTGIDNDGTDAAVAQEGENGVNLDTIVNISTRNNISVATVQSWVDGTSTNYGWMVEQITSATGDGVQFASSENATTGNRPLLTVVCQ